MNDKNDKNKVGIKKYIGILESETDNFGLRFATAEDSKSISNIMYDGYKYEYLTPEVYSESKLQKHLQDPDEFWWVAESLDGKSEPIAVCFAQKTSEYSIYAGKTVVKSKFRGKGIANKLGVQSLQSLFRQPKYQNLLRLEVDVRSTQVNAQVVSNTIGCVSIGFVPNYNNYADKRNYNPSTGVPYTSGKKEAVVLFFVPLNDFWKKRSNNVVLYNHPSIVSFYDLMRRTNKKMKFDTLELLSEASLTEENFSVKVDYFKGNVKLLGLIQKKAFLSLMETYKGWNVIEWRIPATIEGVSNQKIALEQEFIVAGYDPGHLKKGDQLIDCIILCKFPRGVDKSQFDKMNLTKKNKFIADHVLEQLDIK
ncbi:MAG: GNAT family N-acetyltransferase [Candidatus Lokiarchaeota archaeon]|nr:GNAT family N-acetyltransferase [Candidatus Lokiarchaeota archaeon]